MSALNQTVDVSGQEAAQKAGDLLVDQVKQAGSETRNAMISEIVGQIIGAAGRSFLSGS
jgi:hypothetical protein